MVDVAVMDTCTGHFRSQNRWRGRVESPYVSLVQCASGVIFNCHVFTLRMMGCFGGCEYKQGCNTGGSASPRTFFVTVSFSLGASEYSQLFHALCLCMHRFHHVWTLMIRVWRSCTDRVDLRFFARQFVSICIGSTMFGLG